VLEPLDPSGLRAREFAPVARRPYLNAASVTPLPERSLRAITEHLGRRADPGSLVGDDFEPTLVRARRAAAALIGAGEDEIALLPNTSHGINLAALALPVEAGRRILLHDGEFPANVYPWQAAGRMRGLRVDLLPPDAANRPDEARLLAEIARGDVGIVAVSAVGFRDGWVADLAAIGAACERFGSWLVVDAIQALGQLPLLPRELGIHILATGGHKWLCSPFGTGFAWIRRELVDALEPSVVGWTSMRASADLEQVTDYRFDWVAGARRFEVATQPFDAYAGMARSLELLAETGVAQISVHLRALLDPLAAWLAERGADGLSDRSPRRASGILSFRTDDTAAALGALSAAGIDAVLREGGVRLSPHLYNDAPEMERVMEALCPVLRA
jgi:cysteine desulfurase / selenocysteine lyase